MMSRAQAAEEHRRVLEIPSPFTALELKKGYLGMMRRNHPDLFFGDPKQYLAATERSKEINQSFQFLSEYLEEIGGTYSFVATQREASYPRPKGERAKPRYTYEGDNYTEGFPDETVLEVFLRSSHIVSTGYNPTTKTLYIKFKGNRIYRYTDVPERTYKDFLSAESHGKFGHKYIYKSFDYEEV